MPPSTHLPSRLRAAVFTATVTVRLAAACFALLPAIAAAAQPSGGDAPVRRASSDIPVTKPGRAYDGVLGLQIDATDLARKIVRVRETLPVRPGRLTLVYPEWIPGTHSPSGDVTQLAGLQLGAGGKRLAWQRDPLQPFAFHVDVPPGVREIDASFEFLSPHNPDNGRVVITPKIIGLQWNTLLLYPAGYDVANIRIDASATLPAGWQAATALDIAARSEQGATQTLRFSTTSVETLVDSPLWAGRHARRIVLDGGASRPVTLHVFADNDAQLDAKPEAEAALKALVAQADKLFASRHYPRYDFLLAISDTFSGIGLEHHASSENAVTPGFFTDWPKPVYAKTLLPHEYTHSWNGKFRRPRGLATPDFHTPMRDELLWLYEGMTEYWGMVLTARAGLMKPEDVRELWAETAAWVQQRSGRAWRNLQDTTNTPVMTERRGDLEWRDWQRSADYYSEMALVWLDADTRIRELSGGQRSLDDFARRFFGVEDGRTQPLPYDFDDIVRTLNEVQPDDWGAFLRSRLDRHDAAPLDGLRRGGWQLTFSDEENAVAKAGSGRRTKTDDFIHSLGFDVSETKLRYVMRDSPAFKAGLAPGVMLVAVNSQAYSADVLKDAVKAAKNGKEPIELLVRRGDTYSTVKIDYRGGLRYPHLVRIDGSEDRFGAIMAPRP